jgi:hypothetical protein
MSGHVVSWRHHEAPQVLAPWRHVDARHGPSEESSDRPGLLDDGEGIRPRGWECERVGSENDFDFFLG